VFLLKPSNPNGDKMMRSNTRRHTNKFERGQIILLFIAALPAIMAIFALMVDLGGAAITYHRAQIALDAATFAGAQAVDMDIYDHEQRIRLDAALATNWAGQYLSVNQRGGIIMGSFYVEGDTVYGVGVMEYRTLFLSAIGIGTIRTQVTSAASPGWGISEEWE
jgi:hypothetical protein